MPGARRRDDRGGSSAASAPSRPSGCTRCACSRPARRCCCASCPATGAAKAKDLIEGAIVEHNPCLSGGALEIVLEPQLPAARIVVVGSAPIALALAKLAGAADYDVVQASSGDDIHPGPGDAAVIVASHGSDEERVLSDALTTCVPYVALVASRTRGTAVGDALDVPDEARAQLRTPAGLDIGARTPAEIAISILAEIVAEHHARPAGVASPASPATTTAADSVCGMRVAVTAATPQLVVDGEHVFFCGDHCRDSYAAQHAVHGAG